MTSGTSLRFKKFAEEGELTIENFDVVTEKLPELKDGEVQQCVELLRPIVTRVFCVPRCSSETSTYPAIRPTGFMQPGRSHTSQVHE